MADDSIRLGGSKGVILPDIGASPRLVFEKYVDSIIDLLLPGRSPGIKESIVDFYKKEEIVSFFFHPFFESELMW